MVKLRVVLTIEHCYSAGPNDCGLSQKLLKKVEVDEIPLHMNAIHCC